MVVDPLGPSVPKWPLPGGLGESGRLLISRSSRGFPSPGSAELRSGFRPPRSLGPLSHEACLSQLGPLPGIHPDQYFGGLPAVFRRNLPTNSHHMGHSSPGPRQLLSLPTQTPAPEGGRERPPGLGQALRSSRRWSWLPNLQLPLFVLGSTHDAIINQQNYKTVQEV